MLAKNRSDSTSNINSTCISVAQLSCFSRVLKVLKVLTVLIALSGCSYFNQRSLTINLQANFTKSSKSNPLVAAGCWLPRNVVIVVFKTNSHAQARFVSIVVKSSFTPFSSGASRRRYSSILKVSLMACCQKANSLYPFTTCGLPVIGQSTTVG